MIYSCKDCDSFLDDGTCVTKDVCRDQYAKICPHFRGKTGALPHYCALALDVEKMAEAIIFRITFTAASGTKHEYRFRGRVYRSKKKAIEAAMNWLMESEDEK